MANNSVFAQTVVIIIYVAQGQNQPQVLDAVAEPCSGRLEKHQQVKVFTTVCSIHELAEGAFQNSHSLLVSATTCLFQLSAI